MPLRLLKYSISGIEAHLKKERQSNKSVEDLPLFYPLLLYNGKQKYPYSMDLFELFQDPNLARQIFLQPFQLVDLSSDPG